MSQALLSLVPPAAEPPLHACTQTTAEPPIERLQRAGAAALSDAELLSVLLDSPLSEASELLEQHGGLRGLVTAPLAQDHPRVLAAVDLAVRIARARLPRPLRLDRSHLIVQYLSLKHTSSEQEVMGALFLDVRNGLLGEEVLHIGTLSKIAAEPAVVLRHAIRYCASRIVLFHTHPSGDPAPSAEDLYYTRSLAEAGELLRIHLLDHIILGHGGRWTSLKDRGAW